MLSIAFQHTELGLGLVENKICSRAVARLVMTQYIFASAVNEMGVG
jgi:hypothetical protein